MTSTQPRARAASSAPVSATTVEQDDADAPGLPGVGQLLDPELMVRLTVSEALQVHEALSDGALKDQVRGAVWVATGLMPHRLVRSQ